MTKRDHRYYGSTWRCPATGLAHTYEEQSDDEHPGGYIKCSECNAGYLKPTKFQSSPLRYPPVHDRIIEDEWHRGPTDEGVRD